MRIGVPTEVKNNEFRVAITPAGAMELTRHGHDVLVQSGAGQGSSISDAEYVAAGAQLRDTADEVWGDAEMVLKVKEPVAEEYHRIRAGQVVFTYLHLAASRECTDAILRAGATAIALGMQAEVLLLDKNIARLRQMDAIYQGHMQTVASNAFEVERAVLDADMVIGAVLVPGAKAPTLVSNVLVSRMKPGSVLVDIAIDQGGCFEDSRPTTHDDPTYRVHDSVFYCVANMPGAVPHTSTYALTNVTLPYAVALADKGWRQALADDAALALGLNVHEGSLTYEAVAEAFDLPYVPVAEVLA